MKRRELLARAGVTTTFGVFTSSVRAVDTHWPSVIIGWNAAVTSSIADSFMGPTVAARVLSMVYEAVYNAWAVYQPDAGFSLAGLRKRPLFEAERNLKSIAVSHAAHTVLSDLFPTRTDKFDIALAQALMDLPVTSVAGIAAMQTGQLAGRTLLQMRASDGSNQYGDLAPGAYADWTGYQSVNSPGNVVDPMQWQPLIVTNAQGVTLTQKFLTPHWGRVRPFALLSGSVFRPKFTNGGPTIDEVNEIISLSAGLNDASKVQVDFFANNPGSVTPPGQWTKFAEIVSATDRNSLDADVVMFFILGQAMLDASIAAWDAKRAYNSVRPISSIRKIYAGQAIQCWGGVGNGVSTMPGEDWMPYQRPTNPTPSFPEFVSGHSTFSAAAATVLTALRGNQISLVFKFPARGIRFDPTVPAAATTLSWTSLSAVAEAAGFSRRYGGIHFAQGDLKGRAIGVAVGAAVIKRAVALYNWGTTPNLRN